MIVMLAEHQRSPAKVKLSREAKHKKRSFFITVQILPQKPLTTTIPIFYSSCVGWLMEYNFSCPHQSLGYLAPMDYIERELAKIRSPVLPMWSASTMDCIAPKISLWL